MSDSKPSQQEGKTSTHKFNPDAAPFEAPKQTYFAKHGYPGSNAPNPYGTNTKYSANNPHAAAAGTASVGQSAGASRKSPPKKITVSSDEFVPRSATATGTASTSASAPRTPQTAPVTPSTPGGAREFWTTHCRAQPLPNRESAVVPPSEFSKWLELLRAADPLSDAEAERIVPTVRETFAASQSNRNRGNRQGNSSSNNDRGPVRSSGQGPIPRGQTVPQRGANVPRNNDQWSRGKAAPKMKEEDKIDVNFKPITTENGWTHEKHLQQIASHLDEVKLECNTILNKLSLEKFDKLSADFLAIDIQTKAELETVIDYIFNKAVLQHAFSSMYADLCRLVGDKEETILGGMVKAQEITTEGGAPKFKFSVGSEIDPTDLKNFLKKKPFEFPSAEIAIMAGKKFCGFARLLRLRCQAEFERCVDWSKFTDDLEAKGLTGDEYDAAKEDVQLQIMREKSRVFGNIKFIGELYKVGLVPNKIISFCMKQQLTDPVNKWVADKTPMDEKMLEAACRLLQTTGKILDQEPKMASFINAWMQFLELLCSKNAKGAVSTRIKFLCQEIIEMRKNDWKGKYKQKVIMTKEESREKAAKEEAERAGKARKKDGWRKGGGRHRNGSGDVRKSGRSSGDSRGSSDNKNTTRAPKSPKSSAAVVEDKPLVTSKVNSVFKEFIFHSSTEELFLALKDMEVSRKNAPKLLLLMLCFCCESCSGKQKAAIQQLSAAMAKVIQNEQEGFDFSWAASPCLDTAIAWLFDRDHPSSYLGDIKIDAPQATQLLAVVLAEFIIDGVLSYPSFLTRLADDASADDARSSGLAAEFCRHLLNTLKAREFDTAPLLAHEKLASLPRWEDQKDRLE